MLLLQSESFYAYLVLFIFLNFEKCYAASYFWDRFFLNVLMNKKSKRAVFILNKNILISKIKIKNFWSI